MAVYKVPQDVEADDKLIGPFSFRQFIYLIIVAISGAAAFGLSQIFIPLVIIPMPLIIFFAALALPLRKDQPMETYLSAVVSFYFLKSRRRMWSPDGIDSFITIIPPKNEDIRRTKDFGEDEAMRRLGYLSELVDSHGWSVRGAGVPVPDTAMKEDLYYESQSTPDVMDTNNDQSRRLTQSLEQSAAASHQQAVQNMYAAPTPLSPTQAPITPEPQLDTIPAVDPFAANQYQPATPYVAETPPATAPELPAPVISDTPVPIVDAAPAPQSQEELDIIAYAQSLASKAAETPRNQPSPPTWQEPQPVNQPESVSTPPITQPEQATDSADLQLHHDTPPPIPAPAQSTSVTPTSDATIKQAQERVRELQELAAREDISIQTMSAEAKRIEEHKAKVLTSKDEVTISLR